MKKENLRLTAIALAALLLPGCILISDGSSAPNGRGGGAPVEGSLAPDFTLARIDGEPMDLTSALGDNKLILLNFWATWCGPCRIEMPHLEQMYRRYGEDGFAVVSINTDSARETAEAYLAENPVSFPVLYDSEGAVTRRYGIFGFPTNIFLDGEGRVLHIIRGYSPYMELSVEKLLKSQ